VSQLRYEATRQRWWWREKVYSGLLAEYKKKKFMSWKL